MKYVNYSFSAENSKVHKYTTAQGNSARCFAINNYGRFITVDFVFLGKRLWPLNCLMAMICVSKWQKVKATAFVFKNKHAFTLTSSS